MALEIYFPFIGFQIMTNELAFFLCYLFRAISHAVSNILPNSEHRSCARHIYANWHKTHKGDESKMLFWNVAKAYNDTDFRIALDKLKKASPNAVDEFIIHYPRVFCRAFMNTTSKSDVIVNNMAETFNVYIVQARAKHLIYMLEDIRLALMERIVLKRTTMEKPTDDVQE